MGGPDKFGELALAEPLLFSEGSDFEGEADGASGVFVAVKLTEVVDIWVLPMSRNSDDRTTGQRPVEWWESLCEFWWRQVMARNPSGIGGVKVIRCGSL